MGAAAGVQRPPEAPLSADRLEAIRSAWPIGSLCVITGLQSALGQQLNGQLAEVRGLVETTGRLCLRLCPGHEPSRWKKVKVENVRRSAMPVTSERLECSFCLDHNSEQLVSPCLCRGTSGHFHLQCLRDAYEARTSASLEYPACPTCKQPYPGSLSLMLLQGKREAMDEMLRPGMQVVMVGLAMVQLNGLAGRLLEYDAPNCRWKVELRTGDVKAVRPENLMQEDSEQAQSRINLLRSLGIAYSSANEPRNASIMLEKAVRIEEQFFGGEELELARSLTNLGIIYIQLEEGEKAVKVLERAQAIREKSLVPDSLDMVAILSNLGSAKLAMGEPQTSLQVLERALAIGERALGRGHPDLVPTLAGLASTCMKLDQGERAVELRELALEAQERKLGGSHQHLVSTLLDLGAAYGAVREHEKQRQILERALDIAEHNLDRESPVLVPILKGLQDAYRSLGEKDMAKASAERAHAVMAKSLEVR